MLASAAAFAQGQVTVIAPSNLAKKLTFGAPGSSATADWGFGTIDDISPAVVATVAQVANADSVGFADTSLGLTDPSRVAGKIAVIFAGRTGASQFGTFGIQCQRAGAVGVLLVKSAGFSAGVYAMAPGDQGPYVTIPMVSIDRNDYLRLRSQILAGNVRMLIGDKTGSLINDLVFGEDNVTRPPNNVPNFNIQAPGDFAFRPVADLVNVGTGLQLAAGFKFQIGKYNALGGLTVLQTLDAVPDTVLPYTGSSQGAVDSATTAVGTDSIIDLYKLVPNNDARVGKYNIKYIIQSTNTQDFIFDDTLSYDFDITPYVYSTVPLNATGSIIGSSGFPIGSRTPVNPRGSINFYFYGDNIVSDSVYLNSVGISTFVLGAADSLRGLGVTVTLNEWTDRDGDERATSDELSPTALGDYTFLANSQELQTVVIPMYSSVVNDVRPGTIKKDSNYVVTLDYQGGVQLYVVANLVGSGNWISYGSPKRGATWQFLVKNAAIPATAPAGQYYTTGTPGIKMQFGPITSTKANLGKQLALAPNPAQNFLNLTAGFATGNETVALEVMDAAGRTVKSSSVKLANGGTRINTSDLAPGIYSLSVKGDAGVGVKKFVIAR